MKLEKLLKAAAFKPLSIQPPNAWVGHLPFAWWLIQELSPKIFVELGTHSGNSYFAFCQSVSECGLATKCYAVDTWEGDEHSGSYSAETFERVWAHNNEHYTEFSRLLKTTFDDAVNYFADGTINILHIDGLHTYEAVQHDFETWLPKLAPGAVVVFHDTNVRERNFGVWKIWEELQKKYPNNIDFSHSNGLGVLQLNNTESVDALEWLKQSSPNKELLSTYFGALGARQLERFDALDQKRNASLLHQQILERNQDIAAQSRELQQRDNEISKLTDEITELAKNLTKSSSDIASHENELLFISAALKERDQLIDTLQVSLDQKNHLLTNLNSIAKERESEISDINPKLTEYKEQIEKLKVELGERDSIAREKDTQISALNEALAASNNEITTLNIALIQREGLLTDFKHSRSWRITKPYRILGHQVKRIIHLRKIMPKIIQHGGGLKPTLNKAFRTFQTEGIEGIKHRLIWLQNTANLAPVNISSEEQVDRNDYQEWIRRYDTLDESKRTRLRDKIKNMESTPLISVVMPTYNANPKWLKEAIASVKNQIYPNWELCIADDASTDRSIKPILEEFAATDPRIKTVFRTVNGHISAASNSALELASGEWVALLDHDDLLSEDALYWVVEKLQKFPEAQILYSDEDKIEESGVRHDPYFKCEWNPDLFYSHNMICHLGVYNRELLQSINGFRVGLEGSQDYDLALRCIERIAPEQIVHIPRVLYHWRVHSESTASTSAAKPYAVIAGAKALNEHFDRMGSPGNILIGEHGYRAKYDIPSPAPKVSLLIPTRDQRKITELAVRSILDKTTYPNFEIIILDNGSIDLDTLNWFETIEKIEPRVKVIRYDFPFNYSAINNFGASKSDGSILGLINNDIEVISPEWLSEMVSHALRPEIGCVGSKLYYPNSTVQHAGVILGIGGVAGHAHKYIPKHISGYFSRAMLTQNFSAVTAACLLLRKSTFEEVGGLDEINLKIAFNDVDLCLKVRDAGYRNLWTPHAELYHHESVSRGAEDSPDKIERFRQEINYMKSKWSVKLNSDPYYSPNLTLEHEDFSLAWPPRIELI